MSSSSWWRGISRIRSGNCDESRKEIFRDKSAVNDPALPGLSHGTVKLVEWTPRWVELYAHEAARLHAALGDLAVAIEHYGSTSVSGLVAKPLLDILVGGLQTTDPNPYIAALQPLGYDYAAAAGVPEHLVFGRGTARTHLVHVVRHGCAAWHQALAFRDALRADSGLRNTYAVLKRELAQLYGADRSQYTAAKSAFIEDVLADPVRRRSD
jgi:GrpB-like predicted nucleotidyltransferase (UPF0157 family)